jgi:plasmid stabilization system protein ParE
MKSSDEIKAIGLSEMNTSTMNEKISALLAFLRANSLEVSFCSDSEELLTQFSRDIQKLKIEFYQEGNESFGGFYNRVVQNTLMITRIFHALKCFENGHWDETINPLTTESAINYMKLVVYPQIDRLIDYLIDKTKLAQEEKQLKRIRTVVEKYLAEHGTMPTTRHVTQYSLVSQKNILRLTRGYLELQPGTTILRYCADAK